MNGFNNTPWTQDELNDIWGKILEGSSYIHKIVQNDELIQVMLVHTPQIAAYDNEDAGLPIEVKCTRIRKNKDEIWSVWTELRA